MGSAHQLTPDDVLEVLENRDPATEPVLNTSEILERLDENGYDVSRPTALDRLRMLAANDEVEQMDVGEGVVWWVAGERVLANPEEYLADGSEHIEQAMTPWWRTKAGMTALFSGGFTVLGILGVFYAFITPVFIGDTLFYQPPYGDLLGPYGLIGALFFSPICFISAIYIAWRERRALKETARTITTLRDRLDLR